MQDNKGIAVFTSESFKEAIVTGKIDIKKIFAYMLDEMVGHEIEDFVKNCINKFIDGIELNSLYLHNGNLLVFYYYEDLNDVFLEKIKTEITGFFNKIKRIKNSSFDDIVQNHRDWYKKNIGISPEVRDFFPYLVNSDISIFNEENLKKYLAEHVFYEETKILENYQKTRYKKQQLIDITPHQTLSIETAAATEEKGINSSQREITYYTLLNRSSQRHIEEMADTMPQEEFVKLGYAEKWLEHLWVSANNEAFLNRISQIKDIVKLDYTLREQIKSYARKNGEGNEQHKGDLYSIYISRKNWLSQTIFICRDEYKKTSNEVFNEVVKWCESWQNEWLEHYNPSKIEVMENINPTTSATVEEGKKVEIIDFVKDINPCIEFDNLFRNDIKGKIEIWNYMIDLKMIDSNGVFSMGSRRSFIRSFVLIMKKYFKIPNQSDTKLTEIFRLKLLGNSGRINNSVKADEQQIEDFLNGN